jgi:hypothetical protein
VVLVIRWKKILALGKKGHQRKYEPGNWMGESGKKKQKVSVVVVVVAAADVEHVEHNIADDVDEDMV